MLTLLTVTGERPQAFELCQRWMAAQTYAGQVRWIIVDDGREAQKINFEPQRGTWNVEVYRPEPLWTPGRNTQARNLLAGLSVIKNSERLVIIEDDDYYAPEWLETVDEKLNKAQLVGEVNSKYYNIIKRIGKEMRNYGHASLCSTALRDQAIETFRSVCRPGIEFIDHILWQAHSDRHLFAGKQVVGMKGLPGRQGIGMGHDKKFTGLRDNDGKLLIEWVGFDAACLYREDLAKWPQTSEN